MVEDASETETETKDVRIEVRGAVLFAWLNRPQQGNSIHGRLLGDLIEAVEEADSNDDVRVVVTIGEGSTWCVGADKDVFTQLGSEGGIDLHELGYQGLVGGDWGMPEQSAGQKRSDTLGMGRWINRFLDVGTPTIAAINGGVAGGGLALALLHDFRIASTRAKFSPAFMTLGVSPEMGFSWFLPRIVGYSRAFDVITRTAPIEADEALELGLVHSVVKPAELEDAALALAQRVASFPPVSVRMAKRLLRQATASTLDDQLEREWHNQTRLFGFTETGAVVKEYLGRF